MDIPKDLQLNAQTLILGNRSLSSSTEQVNIISSNGTEIKINGVVPGGGGDDSLPITGNGDIRITGDITALGDGLTNGRMEAQTIKSIDNLVISSGSLEVTTGGVDIKANGNMTLEGNGNINQLGTGKITSGTGGIESKGDIKTLGTFDLEVGKDIYFDGDDIYHRTNNPAAQKSYKDYKQLAGLNDANVFTGANQFNSNTTEFAAKVSVGTRDAVSKLFTQNLALNTSGNIESKTINNGTIIQCGNINCGNGGDNLVRARQFKTRTNENNSPEGWTIEQQLPSNPAVTFDRALAFKGGEANAFISILDNAHGIIPNIVLDPRTSALGGLIVANTYAVGPSEEGFKIEQPNSGGDTDNLLIKAGLNEGVIKFQNYAGTIDLARIERDSVTNQGKLYCPAILFGTTGQATEAYKVEQPTTGGNTDNLLLKAGLNEGSVKFQNNAGNIDLAIIQKDSVTNQGRIYCPAIFFGTTGLHNSIVNDTSGPDSLVLKVKQATASSKVEFLDNAAASIMEVKKDEIELGPSIPISFGGYSFRPTQYYKDITGFSFNHQSLGATNLIFTTNDTDWTNVNTGATNQQINLAVLANQGAWKLTLRQTSGGTLGQINAFRLMSDMCLSRANDNLPQVVLPSATAYSYEAYDGDAPIITMSPGFLIWNVYATFPQTSGNETANVRITMTQMPFFA